MIGSTVSGRLGLGICMGRPGMGYELGLRGSRAAWLRFMLDPGVPLWLWPVHLFFQPPSVLCLLE